MKNSGNSSARTTPPSPGAPPSAPPHNGSEPRKAFALTGKSVDLDPRTHAVRGDLADVRLAEHVFAPHYAAPMTCMFRIAVDLLVARDRGSDVMARMQPGDLFEVLELAGANAWGIAPAHGLVGYVDRQALDRCPA